ncbi:glycosyltransferase family 4 protein [Lyngbya sp. CCY1209]|uniref:glycosyltransferase family 4 protein n=1 Tax=Lyngbya sp. CCY1209 TaxID=2886103 RepID=UPI002D1FD7E2|nr:glycosyltransferase family 4 protein [Lyngbya sp. CCY1209]MEB3884210.1 glycosyltransferase family 4 protein [Lyngbya sp. CCY1209]
MTEKPLKLLFMSTPVAPLGSGFGGGVELTLLNITKALQDRSHEVEVVAPLGSELDSISIVEIPGEWQPIAQNQGRNLPIILPENSVLANIWEYGRSVQHQYDAIVNFAYDWLPFYLTPFFQTPIAHWVSMGSLTSALDRVICEVMNRYPGTVGFYTHTQAATFNCEGSYACLGSGLQMSRYQFCPQPEDKLAWMGRISPEKGLEDAVEAAQKTGISLEIFGKIQDENYWQNILESYPDAPINYIGFLDTDRLQERLRHCRGLLMTHRWVEAFGNVAIEALACGVPVIAYRRGGPAEIVCNGETGWLVEPDSVEGLVEAIANLDQIDRENCRQQAEMEYSLEALGDRVEWWLLQIRDG